MSPKLNTKYLILNTSQRGATLLEVLIYILLFSFVMTFSLISINQILAYSYSSSIKSSVEEEGAFIMAKINNTLNDAQSITAPSANSTGSILTVTKSTGQTTINRDGNFVEINGDYLNSSRTRVSSLSFDRTTDSASSTDIIKSSFYIEGKYFETLRYVR
jgi:hypothetical protein